MCWQLQAQLLRKYWNLVLQLKCVPELTGQMVSSTYTDLKINTERHKKGNEPKYSPLTARTFQGCLTSKESWRRWPPAGQGRGQCCTELVHCPQKAKSSYLFQNHEPLTALLCSGNSDAWISRFFPSPSFSKGNSAFACWVYPVCLSLLWDSSTTISGLNDH